MKRISPFLLLLLLTVCVSWVAQQGNPFVQRLQDAFSFALSTPSEYGRQSTVISVPGASAQPTQLYAYAKSPAYFTGVIRQMLESSTPSLAYTDSIWKEADLTARQMVGKPLVAGYWKMRYDGYSETVAKFSGEGILVVFQRFYQPPSATFGGHTYQHIYNLCLKHYVRGGAHILCELLANKDAFRQVAAEYAQRGLQPNPREPFNAVVFQEEKTRLLLPAPLVAEWNRFTENLLNPSDDVSRTIYGYPDRLLGMLIRRHLDGSLPQCLEVIKRVLKDYDPEAYAQYGPRLVAP
jgi:hypothetical protein